MKRKGESFALKPLLLSTAAATILAIPAAAQEQMPSKSQDRPAATQSQSPGSSQPSAQQDRRQRMQDRSEKRDTTGQGSPRQNTERQDTERQDTDTPAGTSKPGAAQDREGQSPSQPKSQQKQRSQSKDVDRGPGKQQMQSRDTERMRNNQRTQSRDTDRTQQRAAPDRQRQQDDARSPQNRTGESARDSARSGDSNRQAAQPTEQERTRISTSIRQANVQPVRNVNFSVSVGTAVPASVRLYPVTPAIVAVYPQYRGYSFVLVEDEIVIVEPRTKKIVTVIDQRRRSGRAASVSRSKLTLTDKQRDVIRRGATERRTTGSGGQVTTMDREIVVGDELPETVEIESFPDTVYTEVPEIRSYRYIVRDRDIFLVDPAERRVIEVIR
ncbi:DUF1236 domain-containing protein [Pseudorhodoplanes sinuspersici]|uniref:Uncharacterized protein n=1 Tax=Pseudorhodoplanes sinuspersici TaxID=1235591 RepID=A0A1W6ZTR7_9HYPH|nr:DUF1236 domain-containing protein [Pseudorhodoplanes sinuspersici]ARQ00740.1 hypothetical protein CAK95_17845 [Pseudorhodoplanes sinuspersici]RKE72349.1 uncharacterized protein DUF1236 [Pseudorhodoplanes sinuspersici]